MSNGSAGKGYSLKFREMFCVEPGELAHLGAELFEQEGKKILELVGWQGRVSRA